MQNGSLSAAKGWFGGYLRRRTAAYELANDAEADRMAQDLGISLSELRTMAAEGPEAGLLLHARIAELGLDDDDLATAGPQATRDLQRLCSLCKDHRRCRHDLDAHDRSDAWLSYCPNAPTLQALVAARARSSVASSASASMASPMAWPPSFIQRRVYR